MIQFSQTAQSHVRTILILTILVLLPLKEVLADCQGPRNNSGNYHGVVKCTFVTGQIESVTTYQDGKLHGPKTVYHMNGKVESEENYQNNLRHGAAKYYSYEGFLKEEKTYQNGVLQGPAKTYHPEPGGKIHETGSYEQDQKHGVWKTFNSDGTIVELTTYNKGNLDGVQEKYLDGKLIEFITWKNNTRDGLQKDFYANGKPRAIWYEKDTMMHGLSTSYHLNGEVEKVRCYQNDKEVQGLAPCEGQPGGATSPSKTEVAESFYKNGKLRDKYTIKNGKKDGPYSVYFENGVLAETGTYRDGLADGEIKAYHENGKLKVTGTFKMGKKHGPEKNYRETGELQEETLWENDKAQIERTFYQNGNPETETIRKDNLLAAREYWDNGNLMFEGTFTETIEYFRWGISVTKWRGLAAQGKAIHYRENGSREFEANYKDDKLEGLAITYHKNGKIKFQEVFKDDRLVSKKEYDESGKLILDEEYFEDGSRKLKNAPPQKPTT